MKLWETRSEIIGMTEREVTLWQNENYPVDWTMIDRNYLSELLLTKNNEWMNWNKWISVLWARLECELYPIKSLDKWNFIVERYSCSIQGHSKLLVPWWFQINGVVAWVNIISYRNIRYCSSLDDFTYMGFYYE